MDLINTSYLSTGLHHETVLKPGRDKEQKRKPDSKSSSEPEDAETAGRRKRHAAKTIHASSAPFMPPSKRRPILVEKPTVAGETEETDANDKRPQTTTIGM
jgi:hypothetical protein